MRRVLRALAWIALSALLLALLAATTLILWARSPSGRRLLLSTAVSALQKELAGRLTIGALEGDLTRQIVLRQVRLYDREHKLAVAIDAIRIEHDPVGLLSREVRIRSLAVQGARVYVRRQSDGALSLAALPKSRKRAAAPGGESARPWALAIHAVRVDAQVVVDVRADRPALHGTFALAGGFAWRDAAPVFHDLRARLTGPLAATLRIDGPPGAIDAELLVAADGGELRAHANASIAAGGPLAWRATIGSRDLDPAALVPGAAHGTIALAAHGRGEDATGWLVIDRLTLDAAGTHASIEGTVERGTMLLADLRAELRSPDLSRLSGDALPALHGHVDARAHLRRTSTHTYVDAAVETRGLHAGTTRVASLDARVHAQDLEGHLDVEAHDLEISILRGQPLHVHSLALTANGNEERDEVSIDRLVVDGWRATAPGRLRIGRDAVVGTLALAAHEQTLSLDGTLDRDGGRLAVDLHARHLDASRLALSRVVLPRTLVDVDAELRGTRAAPELRIAVRGRSLPWPQHDLPAIALTLDATADARRIRATIGATAPGQKLHATVDAPIAPSAGDAIAADLEAHGIALAPLRPWLPPSLRSLTGNADLAAHLHGALGTAEAELHAAAHGLAVGRVDGIDLTVDGTYGRGEARLTASGTIHGEPALALEATSRVDLHQPWRALPIAAELTIPSFDLSRVGALGGVVEGAAELRGTLAHPTAHAELHGRDLGLSELRLTTIEARADWDGHALAARVDGTQTSGGTLHLDASVPAATDAPMQATLKADAFTFAIDDVGKIRRLEGTLTADLRLSGPRAHPTLAGTLRIDRGAFAAGSDPRLFRDLTLDLTAHDGALELRTLTLHAGRGTLSAHGHATLDGVAPTAIDLAVDAERFPFDATNAAAWLDAAVTLHGHRAGDKIEGAVTVTEGKAHLGALDQRRALQPTGALEDVVYVDEPEPKTRAHAPPDLHVLAHIPGPFHVESRELHAELSGELDVRSDGGKLGIYGHAEAASGQFELLGRTYEIERARVSFDGGLDPVVDVRLTRAMSDTTVVIAVHGTAKAPTLELTSDPPVYNESQVLGLIVSGDPDNARSDAPSADQQLVGAISGALVSQITGQIVSRLPLDVIKLDTGGGASLGGLSGARLEVGKYLRHDIYVSYSHQFGTTVTDLHRSNAHELNFEYRIRRHLVLGVRYGDAGIGAIDIAWTLRY